MAPVVDQECDDDDVSSFGQDEEAQLETQAPEPLPFRRPKYARSALKEPALGATPDEQVILEQLSGDPSPPAESEKMVSGLATQQENLFPADEFPTNTNDADDENLVTRRKKQNHAGCSSKETTPNLRAHVHGQNKHPQSLEKFANAKSPQKRRERDEPDLCPDSDEDSLFNYQPEAKTRRTKMYWTEDETKAVTEGVMRFGLGKWSKVKQWAGPRLQNRDTVAIKDKWRNIERASIEINAS